MTHRALFVRTTANRKTGPIPVTYTEAATCPDACPLKGGHGCYAEGGPTAMAWKRAEKHGVDWDTLCDEISRLPRHQRWRHNVAGDLPGQGDAIDGEALAALVAANSKARAEGWTYTHKPVLEGPHAASNAAAVKAANEGGFRVNLSADDLAEADALKALGIGPVVVTLPSDAPAMQRTPGGNTVIVCPAEKETIDCARCGICQKNRAAIVGFRAHGSRAKKVDARLKLTVVR
jgi:hypothetical protein